MKSPGLMNLSRGSFGLGLGLGLGLGFAVLLGSLLLVGSRLDTRLEARGTDRFGDTIMATGVVGVIYNPTTKMNSVQEALYYLDYKNGRLLAAIPELQKIGNTQKILSQFFERDLVQDFQITPGSTPHFMMITGELAEGWEPLFIVESQSGRIAAYRLQMGSVGAVNNKASRFELIEIRNLPPAGNAVPGSPSE